FVDVPRVARSRWPQGRAPGAAPAEDARRRAGRAAGHRRRGAGQAPLLLRGRLPAAFSVPAGAPHVARRPGSGAAGDLLCPPARDRSRAPAPADGRVAPVQDLRQPADDGAKNSQHPGGVSRHHVPRLRQRQPRAPRGLLMEATTRTASFFDAYAKALHAIYGNENTLVNGVVNRLFRKSMMLRYEKSLAGCQPIQGKTVIDIGCGPGHYGGGLGAQGASRVLGVDFAPGMIEIARKRAESAGVTDRCTFTLGGFLAVPGPERFDYA